MDNAIFPTAHEKDVHEPSSDLQFFVSEQVWESLPKVQHRVTLSKTPKCESQQQFCIVDNSPVFSITGTNISKPGLKRRWQDESEDLVRAIKRKHEASANGTQNVALRPQHPSNLMDMQAQVQAVCPQRPSNLMDVRPVGPSP